MDIASARISAIVHATEDSTKVLYAMHLICSDQEFHPRVMKQIVKGHFGNTITRIDFALQGRSANHFFEDIWFRLSALDRATIIGELDDRLDAEGRLYLRIDKQECFRGNLQMKNADPLRVQVTLRGPHVASEEIRQYLDTL